jgi:hypothetical protein
MFYDCQTLTEINLDVPKLVDGTEMLAKTNITSIDLQCPKLAYANNMFDMCKVLNSVTGKLDSVTTADTMFRECDKLVSVSLDMPMLESAKNMFQGASTFKSFTGNLARLKYGNQMFKSTIIDIFDPVRLDFLENGTEMFWASRFKNWSWNMPALKHGNYMFQGSQFIEKFQSDLPRLVNGTGMFDSCPLLKEFTGSLPMLQQGDNMFKGCKLNPQSVIYIIESLPTYESGTHNITIGIDCAQNNDALDAFAQEAGYINRVDMHERLFAKGWTTTWSIGSNLVTSL